METSKYNPQKEWLFNNKWPEYKEWEENKKYYEDKTLNELKNNIHQIKLTLELIKLDIKKLEENI